MRRKRHVEFSDLMGKILVNVEIDSGDDEVTIETQDGDIYRMYHEQDCCESVWVEDVNGILDDIIGSPIVMADESTNCEESLYQSTTWTFYRLATVKGYVTIRWCGQSNGYYSESVSFYKEKKHG